MNYLWGGMLLIGILYGSVTGNLKEVTEAVISSSKEAVTLCVTVAGVTALWCGLMKIAENAGLIGRLTVKLRPVLRFLFPQMPEDHPAVKHISMNMIANILGLGWAATPAGLKAMESLADLEEERRKQEKNQKLSGRHLRKGVKAVPEGTASNEMCTFLIVNISSLQLIPVNVIAYRSQYGSPNPAAVVGPGIAATVISTVIAVIFCRLMEKRRRE